MEDDLRILSEKEIQEKIKKLPEGWRFEDNKIKKKFECPTFMSAINFVHAVAPICEKMEHHPHIHIFYDEVLFEIQRHYQGNKLINKVTDRDFELAQEIEKIFPNYS